MEYDISPVPKPRMTQRDKWQKRPAVMRYRAFADECSLKKVRLPESGATVTFIIAMPASWSAKKKLLMASTPHKSRPDIDNLFKSLSDALYGDDSCVWDVRITKLWGWTPQIIID